MAGLLAHSEDAGDHNLPLMDWYASEPLVGRDPARALKLAADGKMPLVFAFTVRLLAKIGTPAVLDLAVGELARTADVERQRTILQAINTGLVGRRRVPMPSAWAAISEKLVTSSDAEVNSLATAVALTFGDPRALAKLRGVLVDDGAAIDARRQALEALLRARDPQLRLPCKS